MYQSSNRNSFLDGLLDPTAIAILGSIALHATLGASLSFFTAADNEPKKADPGTVKVVQLTPSELQRIPQAPPTPIPTQSIIPSSPAAPPPTTPQLSTSPATIPFSPIRIPLETILPKSLPAKKQPQAQAIPQKQPTAPIFDPNISFRPSPKPTKITTKPTPPLLPTPTPSPIATQPITKKTKSSPSTTTENLPPGGDGSDVDPTNPTPSQNDRSQQPSPTPQPSITPTPSITPQPSNSPNPTDGNEGGLYGKYTDAAISQLMQYMKEYDVTNPYISKDPIIRSYPKGMLCSKEKQAPFIILMAVFDKFPDNPDAAILGEGTAPSVKVSTFKDRDTPEQRTLAEIATRVALEEANKADQNRPAKDKGKRVIYQYRVQFDPTTCKK